MSSSYRILQVNENVRRELSPLLVEMIDWQGTLGTVTQVITTADLRYATVYISLLNTDDPESWIKLLNDRAHSLYAPLSERLKMKRVPKLTFKFDDQLASDEKVQKLLDEEL